MFLLFHGTHTHGFANPAFAQVRQAHPEAGFVWFYLILLNLNLRTNQWFDRDCFDAFQSLRRCTKAINKYSNPPKLSCTTWKSLQGSGTLMISWLSANLLRGFLNGSLRAIRSICYLMVC
jgi:hypothetical protein